MYNSTTIPIGKSIRRPSTAKDDYEVVDTDLRCSEKLVLCKPAEYGQHQPNVLIYDLPHAKCCIHNDKIIQFGETILDAEVCVPKLFYL